ncbi:MAG TPA: NosD domain-containing protein [Azospirillum sp.]|nr:NosD domain-containing protein [Azospirillum sp.]
MGSTIDADAFDPELFGDTATPRLSQLHGALGTAREEITDLMFRNDVVTVRKHAAAGNGVADDAAAFHAARDAAGVAGTVVVPPGVYALSTVTLSVPGQRWVIARGATLRLKAGANADLLVITAPDVTVCGVGIIDGAKAAQTAECNCIHATGADRLTISGVTVKDATNVGILAHDASDVSIKGARVENTDKSAIVGFCTDVDVTGWDIQGVYVDRSAVVGHSGIQLVTNSTTGKRWQSGKVHGCTVVLHPAGTGLGIEIWGGGDGMSAVGNTVIGGAHGISFDKQRDGSVSGNTCRGYSAFGIELAGCENTTATGNTAVAGGNGTIGTGVAVNGTGGRNNSVIGNTCRNNNYGVFVIGNTGTAVTGNPVESNAAGTVGIWIQNADHTTVRGNVLDGRGTGSIGALILDSSYVVFDGNPCRGWTAHWLQLAATATNMDFVYIGRNPVSASGGHNIQQQNGFTIGERSQFDATQDYSQHYWGGAHVLTNIGTQEHNAIVGWSTETPNGRIRAGAGSIVLHRHPHSAMTYPSGLWVKATPETDGTGWLPVSLVRSGPTADRPLRADGSALTTDHAGMSYFDTTINKAVWWSGAGWVDAAGAAA